MSTFDERREAFENMYAHDQTQRFKIVARRNKLLGLWVAEQLGKSGADAETYAKSVVMADFEEAGDGDVLRKIRADLEAAGKYPGDADIQARMFQLLARAEEEVKAGG